MPNEPRPAAEKRSPATDRKNAQGDHEGSPHRPEEFDALNPAKQVSKGSSTTTDHAPAKDKAPE